MCLTASQIQWTADVTKALGAAKERGDQKALKSLKKKQVWVVDNTLDYQIYYLQMSKQHSWMELIT